MKRFLLKLLTITGMLITWSSAHAVSCTIAVSSLTTIAFDPTTPLQLTGTVSGSCTPATPAEASTPPTIYIGINPGGRTPRSMIRSGGTDLVSYQINKSGGAGIWDETAGTTVTTTNGGLLFTMAIGKKNTAQPYSYTFFLNIPAQPTAPVGTYNDTAITATIWQGTNNAGTQLAITTFGLTATIAPNCRFSTSAPTLNLNYTSFSATAATGTSVFALTCNAGTSITNMTVTPATGTALGINYTMAASPTTGTGTALPQNFTVTGTAAAGQAGTCAVGPCTTSPANSHTITVFF